MTDSSKQVGRYEIENMLGEGGFGIVYKANDTTLDRPVALKQLRAELSSSPQALERFKQESRSMGSLNHPNIIKVLEVFEDSGRYFIAMDYMPNGSLANKLEQGVPFSVEKTVEILKPIARALDYAHGKNLIHRDIKPSNILFTEEDDPVLSDFGLVKSLVNQGLTTTGTTFGTPEYMAPEQILGRELTPAADLYSLGVVAYQMLTGSVPFQGNTPFEIQEGHVHTPPPDIETLHSGLPKGFTAAFRKALEKRPEDRYTSAKEFVQGLEEQIQSVNHSRNLEMMNQVDAFMVNHDYRAASTLLEEMNRTSSNKEIQDKLEECRRRTAIIEKKMNLEVEIDEKKLELDGLLSGEKWLNQKSTLSEKQGNKLYNLVRDVFIPISISLLGIGQFYYAMRIRGIGVEVFVIPSLLLIAGIYSVITKKFYINILAILLYSAVFLVNRLTGGLPWFVYVISSLCVAALIMSLIGKKPFLVSVAFLITGIGISFLNIFRWWVSIPLLLIAACSIFTGIMEIRKTK